MVTDDSSFRICSDLAAEAMDAGTTGISAQPSVMRLGDGAETSLIGAKFTFDEIYGKALLNFLPPVIYVPSGSASAESLKTILRRLGEEIDGPRLGSGLVVNHLALIALVQAVRVSLSCEERPCTGWLGALADHKISTSLRMMHSDVARRWTLVDLATAVGMSRSSFAERFKALVGMPPLDYLLHWRIHLAARKLLGSNRSISAVASEVGYESESAFSNAFKRTMGNSPKAFRMRVARRDGSSNRLPRDGTKSEFDASTDVPSGGGPRGTNSIRADN